MRAHVAWVMAAVAFSAACGSMSSGPDPREGDAKLRKSAAKQARDVMKEAYQSIRRGDIDGLQTLLTADAFVVGPAAGDVFISRSDAVVALAGAFPPGKKHKVTSRALQVVSSPGGKSAWVADRVEIDGDEYRVSAIFAEIDEIWQVVALHVSAPMKRDRAQKLAREGKLPPPPALRGGVDGGAADVVDLVRAAGRDPERLLDQLGGNDVVIVGVEPKDMSRGAKAIKKAWKKPARRSRMSPLGNPRAAITVDGTLAWVFANGDLSTGDDAPFPARSSFVYERTEEGWRLVSIHHAVAPPR